MACLKLFYHLWSSSLQFGKHFFAKWVFQIHPTSSHRSTIRSVARFQRVRPSAPSNAMEPAVLVLRRDLFFLIGACITKGSTEKLECRVLPGVSCALQGFLPKDWTRNWSNMDYLTVFARVITSLKFHRNILEELPAMTDHDCPFWD